MYNLTIARAVLCLFNLLDTHVDAKVTMVSEWQKVEDALQKGSDNSNLGMVLKDDQLMWTGVLCQFDIENEIVIVHNFIRDKYWLKFLELESLVPHSPN